MNEQEMKILHEKIDAGAIAIAQAIERHRKLGESISIIQEKCHFNRRANPSDSALRKLNMATPR